MPSIEELLQRDIDIATAESAALQALAVHLRESAVALPDGSRLAPHFARHSLQFDKWSRHRGHEAQMGGLELNSLLRDIEEDER